MVSLVEYSTSGSEDDFDDNVSAHSLKSERCEGFQLPPSADSLESTGNVLSSVDYASDQPADYFNICSVTSSASCRENSEILHGQNSHQPAAFSGILSDSSPDFWSSELPPCDWNCVANIWGLSAEASDCSTQRSNKEQANSVNTVGSRLVKSVELQSNSAYCKRIKLRQGDTSAAESFSSDSSPKACLVVHPHIAPHLINVYAKNFTNRCPKHVYTTLLGHSGPVNRIDWCSAEYGHLLLSASMDSTVRVWNCLASSSQPCVRSFNFHTKAVKDAVWFDGGRNIVSCGFDKTARVYDVECGKELCICSHEDFVTCVKVNSVDDNMLVTGLTNVIYGWDRRIASKPIKQFKYKDRFGQVQDICFLRNKTHFLSSADLVSRDSADRSIMVWDFNSGAVLSNQVYHERYTCTRLRAHPTAPVFLAQTHGDYIAEFSDIPPYRINKCKRFEKHKVAGYGVGFDVSPDGKMVASGSSDGQLVVYDFRVARIVRQLHTNDKSDVILDVAWNPALLSTVAASTWSGSLVVWR